MNDLELFGRELISFALQPQQDDTGFYRTAFLNYLGTVLSGCRDPAVSILAKTCAETGSGRFIPLGRRESMSLADCVKTDCFSSAVQAYDDIHFETTTHPCGPVASAILGIARLQDVSAEQAVSATVTGMEVECRIGRLLFNAGSGSAPGWYTTGIAGGMGAAAACGRLMGFDRQTMENAVSLAAANACGTRGTHGSMAGSFIPAIAAANGIESALLAHNGFTCTLSALTGKNGLIRQISPEADPVYALEGIGTEWISMNTSCKPYPFGFISYGVIDALLKLDGLDSGQIQDIELTVSERVYDLGKNRRPQNLYEGIVSVPYLAARTLLDRKSVHVPLPCDFRIAKAESEMIGKIRLTCDPDLNDESALVSVNSGMYTVQCMQAQGSPGNPMKAEAVSDKFDRISGLANPELFRKTWMQSTIDSIYPFIQKYME